MSPEEFDPLQEFTDLVTLVMIAGMVGVIICLVSTVELLSATR